MMLLKKNRARFRQVWASELRLAGSRELRRSLLVLLSACLALTACTEEDPTDVGDDLISGDEVRTFEVILDPADFLAYDTSFSGYVDAELAPFGILARQYEGVLDANQLMRLAIAPTLISVRNASGTVVTDTARYFEGRLVVRLDTLATDAAGPVDLALFHTAEAFDASATWTLRVDTGDVELPWATPGGTRGAQIDTSTYTSGDSLVFSVDSATIARWNDTTDAARGALIVPQTADTRLRVTGAVLRLSARADIRQDTVVNVDIVPTINVVLFNPTPPRTAADIRVGGVPAWRAALGLRDSIQAILIPCTVNGESCARRLDSLHVNRAELLLQPVQTSPGFAPELPVMLDIHTFLVAPAVPLERSPIGPRIAFSDEIAETLFETPAATDVVSLDITNYIVALVSPEISDDDRPATALVLSSLPEPATFGYATFAAGPRLRLIVTVHLDATP